MSTGQGAKGMSIVFGAWGFSHLGLCLTDRNAELRAKSLGQTHNS